MRVLVLNMAMQRGRRAFIVDWVAELAGQVEHVDVFTMTTTDEPVPANVRVWSLGKERGHSTLRRVAVFYQRLRRVLDGDRIDVCFVHMVPIFAIMAAPFLRVRRVPMVMWYAHRSLTWKLRLAHRLVKVIVSVNEQSYPYRKDKLVAVGHGIDTSRYQPGIGPVERDLIISVGRVSPIKDLTMLVEAVRLLRERGLCLRCVIVGAPPRRDRYYQRKLERTIAAHALEGVVRLVGAQDPDDVVGWYQRCAVHVNCSPRNHSVDKAPLEAMACGRPTLSSIAALAETMGRYEDTLLFDEGSEGDLVVKLHALLMRSPAEIEEMGLYLRTRVEMLHGLAPQSQRLVGILRRAAQSSRPERSISPDETGVDGASR